LQNQVTAAAASIEQFVNDRQRITEVFARDQAILIQAIAEDPQDSELQAEIRSFLSALFPSFFTFTIADLKGNDLIDDLEGFVGPACVASIQSFVNPESSGQGHQYRTEIHPQANNYHFDTLTRWKVNDEVGGVFFVSFYPIALHQRLAAHESNGHQLLLLHTERENLIEVSSSGARDEISTYRDIVLSPEEAERILARRHVANSHWEVVGLTDAQVFKDQAQQSLGIAVGLIALMAAIGTYALVVIQRSEARRDLVQQNLADKNVELNGKITELTESREALQRQNTHITSLMNELEIAKQRAEALSITDRLTGLNNRLKLDQAFEAESERSRRYKNSLSTVLFDLDHFKSVNDTYGHQIGDDVLVAVANILKENVRATDIPGRWGGEEFIVICPETNLEGAKIQAEKIRAAIEAFTFPSVGKKTASFGVATMRDDETTDDMTKRADEALYKAKEGGRNRVVASE